MSTTHIQANAFLARRREGPTYLALLRAVPDKDGNGGNEVIESSYSRQLVTFSSPANSVMRNEARIDFPVALTDWGSISAWALYDAQSGGTMLWSGNLESAVPVPTGSHFIVDIEGMELSLGLT